MNNWSVAEKQFKHAIDLSPGLEDAYCDLGVLLFQERRVGEATTFLTKALQLNPNDPTAYYDLAAIYQSVGKRDLALVFYKKVLKVRPADPDTVLKLMQLESESETRR
jgi:Flp pilus assembly protein TadD